MSHELIVVGRAVRAATVLLLAAATGGAAQTLPDPVACPACWHPPVGTSWQWQITPENTHVETRRGKLDPLRRPILMFDIDVAFTTAVGPDGDVARLHALGKRVFCYVNVGAAETYRTAEGGAPFWFQFERFETADLGNPYLGFPDELWLDPGSTNVRTVMYERFRYAKDAGCDGVEPDNVDAFTHDLPDADPDDPGTGFSLTPEDQLEYNVYVANTAHSLGLSVLMKNDDLQVLSPTTAVYSLMDYFDGALVEECVQFGFCDAYDPFLAAGKPVFVAEYAGPLSQICSLRPRGFSLIRKRPDLDAWIQACLPPPSPRVGRGADH